MAKRILAAAIANMCAGANSVQRPPGAFLLSAEGLSEIPSYTEIRELPVLNRMHVLIGFGISLVSNGATGMWSIPTYVGALLNHM